MFENIILIPYRNRKEHFDYFLKNSWPLIKENLPSTKLVIIEQEEGKLFNRGKLLNVGFKEYLDKTTYFITHDVDVNPKKSILHLYSNIIHEQEIVGIYSSPCITLGGIIKIKSDNIFKLNGFPNNFWGWGVEDRALYNRAVHFNYIIKFNILSKSIDADTHFTIFNNINDRHTENINSKTRFEYHIFQSLDKEKQLSHIMSSGLSDLDYEILERKDIEDNVEWIKVSI
jgi:hypothetical protein